MKANKYKTNKVQHLKMYHCDYFSDCNQSTYY